MSLAPSLDPLPARPDPEDLLRPLDEIGRTGELPVASLTAQTAAMADAVLASLPSRGPCRPRAEEVNSTASIS